MTDQPTCGQGIAANAVLPAAVGDLLAAMAGVLDHHQRALDLSDPDARPEQQAYASLVAELGAIAARLDALSGQMHGYRTLPMGRHDEEQMAAPEAIAAFTAFVRQERMLFGLLESRVHQHEAMLQQMR